MFKLKVRIKSQQCPLALDQANLTPRQLNGREPKGAVNVISEKSMCLPLCWRREITQSDSIPLFQIFSKCLFWQNELHLEY